MPTKKTPQRIITHAAIVLDKSASMRPIWSATQRALNRNIDDIATSARTLQQDVLVSLYEFGYWNDIERLYHERPIKAVLHDNRSFQHRGDTALYDATARAIEDLCRVNTEDGNDHAFLLVVLTDGGENDSRSFTAYGLGRLIDQVQRTDRWTVTFSVPPGSKRDIVRSLGLHDGNVTEWETSDRGAEQAGVVRAQSLGSYFVNRSQGVRSVQNFYATTDASAITKKDLRQMDNIASEVKVWTVPAEQDIRSFVEGKGVPYQKGCAFYQLTKTEAKVQAYKRLLLMEKGKKAVYEGDQARSLLGLPLGGNARVVPGNHANFDIFIQSTSTNRKLVRGTKVVYYPAAAR